MMTNLPLTVAGPGTKAEAGTFKQCQEVFGISQTTARRLAKAGDIRLLQFRQRGNTRVTRTLVDFESVRRFIGLSS